MLTVRDNPNASNWNVEGGYRSNLNENDVYPYRVFGSGAYCSMKIIANITVDDSFRLCCESIGFIIALHMPDELVDINKNYIFIPPNQYSAISIQPKVTTTSSSLRSYAPQVRGCFFRSERHLRFFRSYNQQNCELECLANYTANECGCVPFYLPST